MPVSSALLLLDSGVRRDDDLVFDQYLADIFIQLQPTMYSC